MGRRDTAILNVAPKKPGEHAQLNIPTASIHNLDNEALKDPCFQIIKADPAGFVSLDFARFDFLTLQHPQQWESGY